VRIERDVHAIDRGADRAALRRFTGAVVGDAAALRRSVERVHGTAEAPAIGGASAGSGPGGEGTSVEGALAQSQEFNLYYLQLQEQLSAENRAFSAMSNVLKTRHDTVKNAIGNIR